MAATAGPPRQTEASVIADIEAALDRTEEHIAATVAAVRRILGLPPERHLRLVPTEARTDGGENDA